MGWGEGLLQMSMCVVFHNKFTPNSTSIMGARHS